MNEDLKAWLGIGSIIVVCLALLGWLIAEFACTRSFVGTLVSRDATVSYDHDERRMVIKEDKDGDRHVSYRGSDRTTARRVYRLTFYAEGQMREIKAGSYSASVPYVRSDMLALQKLNEACVEPTFYTHGKLQQQYVVKVRGWLLDGSIVEMTDLATIKAE
jgi:hypothetical protein